MGFLQLLIPAVTSVLLLQKRAWFHWFVIVTWLVDIWKRSSLHLHSLVAALSLTTSLRCDWFNFRPIHGLVFLYKWNAGSVPSGSVVQDSRLDSIFFAKQVSFLICQNMDVVAICTSPAFFVLPVSGHTKCVCNSGADQYTPQLPRRRTGTDFDRLQRVCDGHGPCHEGARPFQLGADSSGPQFFFQVYSHYCDYIHVPRYSCRCACWLRFSSKIR